MGERSAWRGVVGGKRGGKGKWWGKCLDDYLHGDLQFDQICSPQVTKCAIGFQFFWLIDENWKNKFNGVQN